MELVAEKYKQTEVGLIPEDWEVSKVLHLVITGDGIKIGPFGSQLKKDLLVNEGYKVYGQENVYEKNMNIGDRFITKQHFEKLKTCEIVEGDFLISMMGTIGKCYLVPKVDLQVGIMDSHLIRLRVNKRIILPNLLIHYFSSKIVLSQVKRLSVGGIMDGLSSKIVKQINVPYPISASEQTAIATVLSDTDALIQSLEKLIAKKRNIKQGAIQKLLKPKVGWVMKELGDIADSKQNWSFTGGPFGSNLKSSDYTDKGVRIIQLQNIGDGIFHNESEIYTSEKKAVELISCNIYPGDIILSKMGDPVARACIIPKYHKKYLMCSDGIRLAVDEQKYSTYFIFTFINSKSFREIAENASTGSTRKRIGLTELRNLPIYCPAVEEQYRIALIIEEIELDVLSLEKKLEKYKKIKQGMMQNLLTGKIRLV